MLKINRGTEAKETLVLFAASGMDYLTHISGSHVGTGLRSCRMSSLAGASLSSSSALVCSWLNDDILPSLYLIHIVYYGKRKRKRAIPFTFRFQASEIDGGTDWHPWPYAPHIE